MRFIMTCLVAALSFAACKKEGGGDAVSKMQRFRDTACACKDRACVDKVSEELTRSSKPGELDADDQQKVAQLANEMIKCMTRVSSEAGAGTAAGSAGSAAPDGSGAGSAAPEAGGAAAPEGAGSAAGSGAAAGSGTGDASTMAHRAGNCPSTVLGATTTSAVKGKAVVVTVRSADKDAVAAIQRRTDELLAEKQDGVIGSAHDAKGTYGGSRGLCPVYVPDGATATARRNADGVAVTITPRDKSDELAKEVEGRIARAADWVKTNVPPGERGNQGGVGGGKGQDGSNHSGKGDGKGRERRSDGTGGGMGTGGGGGKGTGGGGGGGTGSGGAGKEGAGDKGAGSGGW
jgi:hypothetical protein